jgi:hypothetical protein
MFGPVDGRKREEEEVFQVKAYIFGGFGFSGFLVFGSLVLEGIFQSFRSKRKREVFCMIKVYIFSGFSGWLGTKFQDNSGQYFWSVESKFSQ